MSRTWPPADRVFFSRVSPLKPDELKVLRDQYEKEGDMAGVQTKFNYSWVCLRDAAAAVTPGHARR